jgi:hypothetical protein
VEIGDAYEVVEHLFVLLWNVWRGKCSFATSARLLPVNGCRYRERGYSFRAMEKITSTEE